MGREGKWERRYYALSATGVGGVTLLASKNTSCTEYDFESILSCTYKLSKRLPSNIGLLLRKL